MKLIPLICLTMIATGSASLACEAHRPSSSGAPKQRFLEDGWQGGSDSGSRPARFHQAMVEIYDQNGDQKLDAAEYARMVRGAERHRSAFIRKHDANGDGSLDAKEMGALRIRIQNGRRRLEQRYDRNGNGTLETEERAALEKEITRRRAKFRKDYDSSGKGMPAPKTPSVSVE